MTQISNQNPSPNTSGVSRQDRTIAFSLANAGGGINWRTLRVKINGVEYSPLDRALACSGALVSGARFHWNTWKQGSNNHAPGSDNWPITWADDDHQYAVFGDGSGFAPSEHSNYVSLGIARIEGSKDNYTGYNRLNGYNPEHTQSLDGKPYGIVCINGVLYFWFCPGSGYDSYASATLYYSNDHGASWSAAPWSFTAADGIIMPSMVQFGKNFGDNPDGYAYFHAVNLKDSHGGLHRPGEVVVMRVPAAQILHRSSYEFYAGGDSFGIPVWSTDITSRVPVFTDSRGIGAVQSCAYNAVLGRYFLITSFDSTQAAGHIQIYEAPNPWGPWSLTYSSRSFGSGHIEQTSFYWNFSPKWWNANGVDFALVFTGVGTLDAWNIVEGRLDVNYPASMHVVFTSDLSWGANESVTVEVSVEDADGVPFKTSYSFTTAESSSTTPTINTTSLPSGEVYIRTTGRI